jgi:trehalose 6-phosphate phosphatase
MREIGLFLDVDGTLLDLAPHPDPVVVPADLIGALAAAKRRLGG